MTKQQKVDQVAGIVSEARRWYTLQEFSDMFLAIWNGLDTANQKAVENVTPPVTP